MIMKKYFIFAALVTAGLLTSCSSSDDAISENPSVPTYGENDQVPIILGASSRADVSAIEDARQYDFTRGTGTVGDLVSNATTNVWGGQHVWVYMMERGTITPAKASETDPEGIYENTEMRTPNPSEGTTGDARELVAVANDGMYQQHRYYPMTGNFDFWAYHIDDAATTLTEGKPTIAQVAATDNDPAKITVPFTIDGSQDLMVAHAWPTDANTDGKWDGTTLASTGDDAFTDFYSAKAARSNLQPDLLFQHLLTRLQFVIKGGNKKTCGWINLDDNDDTNDAFPAAGANYTGIFVKSIKVISKETGSIVAAYTRASETTEPALTKDKLISYDATAAYPTRAQVIATDPAFAMPADYAWFNVKGTHKQASYDDPTKVKGDVTALPALYDETIYNDDPIAAVPAVVTWGTSTQEEFEDDNTNRVTVEDAVMTAEAAEAAYNLEANIGKFYKIWTSGPADAKVYSYFKVTGTPSQPATTKWMQALVIPADLTDEDEPFNGIIRPTWTAATGADEVEVGSALMVSDENTYVMQIELCQLLLDKSTIEDTDENLEGTEVPGAGPNKYIMKDFLLTKDFHLAQSGETIPNFEKGTSYKILITVYGAEEIAIKATLTGWAAGADVPVVLE